MYKVKQGELKMETTKTHEETVKLFSEFLDKFKEDMEVWHNFMKKTGVSLMNFPDNEIHVDSVFKIADEKDITIEKRGDSTYPIEAKITIDGITIFSLHR